MCGIFFSLGSKDFVQPEKDTQLLIKKRGPDSYRAIQVRFQQHGPAGDTECATYLTFISSVLALRGDHTEAQPFIDSKTQSVLCWNGEAWKISGETVTGNDTHHVFQLFLESVKPSGNFDLLGKVTEHSSLAALTQAISRISGPFSFVFYDSLNSRVIYGRDSLGRRSLLSGWDGEGSFKISSVCDGISSSCFEEVSTDGIHVINLSRAFGIGGGPQNPETIPWIHGKSSLAAYLEAPIPPMNMELPEDEALSPLTTDSQPVLELENMLRQSVGLRVQTIPRLPASVPNGARVAILFSGGLDCTVLARLANDALSMNEPIDLLNVAFENPRVIANQPPNGNLCSVYEDCPDRRTGRSSYKELRQICPDRTWRFVCINVPYEETLQHRDTVRRLMRPHNTEMDLSIACALYFSARGVGEILDNEATNISIPYTTPARVLLSGLGADEVFAGYQRHALAFARQGFQGLVNEINLDVGRLGKRNLGRDDRVISTWGREARYPYLDEDFLAWALRRPVWDKCGFGVPAAGAGQFSEGNAVVTAIEPGKKALRLVAWNLGMKGVAREKKRAIQFGSRTAKMESGRSKGTHVLT